MRAPLSYVPMLPVCGGVVVGVLAANSLSQWSMALTWGLATAALIGGILLYYFRFRYPASGLVALALALVVCSPGMRVHTGLLTAGPDGYCGVATRVEPEGSGRRITISLPLHGGGRVKAMIHSAGLLPAVVPGDSLTFISDLSPIAPSSWPDAFDRRGWLRSRGVEYTGYCAIDSMRVGGSSTAPIYCVAALNRRLCADLAATRMSSATCSFLRAALLGDAVDIDPDVRAQFAALGLAHILALSGTHVAVVTMIIGLALFPLWIGCRRRWLAIATVVILWGYALLTGLSASVVRAVLMATFLAGGYLMQRPYSSFNSLLAAAVVLLLFDPRSLWSPGFQMSFAAVGAILLLLPLTVGRLDWRWRRRRWVTIPLTALVLSLAATLGSGIIAAYHFHVFPLGFFVANLPVMALLPPLLMCGAVAIALQALAGFAPMWLCRVADWLYNAVAWTADTTALLPHSALTHLWLTPTAVTMWLLAVAATIYVLWRRGGRTAVIMTCVMWLACAGTFAYSFAARPATQGILVTCGSDGCGAIIYSNSRAWHVSTLTGHLADCQRLQAESTHRLFLNRRGIDSLGRDPKQLEVPGLSLQSNLITLGNTKLRFLPDTLSIHSDSPADQGVNYLVVTKTFRGNIASAVSAYRPDTVVIDPRLHYRVRNAVRDSLRRMEVPTLDPSSHPIFLEDN